MTDPIFLNGGGSAFKGLGNVALDQTPYDMVRELGYCYSKRKLKNLLWIYSQERVRESFMLKLHLSEDHLWNLHMFSIHKTHH